MATKGKVTLANTLHEQEAPLVRRWMDQLRADAQTGQVSEAELTENAKRFITGVREGAASGDTSDLQKPAWNNARETLEDLSRRRALLGFSATQTATFVFSFKQALFDVLREQLSSDPDALARETWAASLLVDKLGMYSVEVFQKTREELIARQQQELMELSTPVVQLWDGILALPLIGTLDSARTQVVMESLLQEIVAASAEIAIIDITGVPTVDTLVAQHLLKTVAAARLMGADCIISGIRPQIAQTIVHLGVELNVVSKATMADALDLALRRIGKTVVNRAKTTVAPAAGSATGEA